MSHQRIFLVALLILSAIFYLGQIGQADIITDESSYATRAIKLVDFDFGIKQPTPWQWVENVPWWMHLSFHDHPPLVFLVQHLSINLFGENPTAIRIPSAIGGVISVWLLYLIGRRLFSAEAGLIAASLFAFTVNHAWISRIGLQESILIPLMLGSVALFLRALKIENASFVRDRVQMKHDGMWLIWGALLLGLAFLTKYLAVILVPIFLVTLWLRRPDLLRSRWIVLVITAFLLVISPVIIYNIQLYRNFGHFDFQLSMLFGQQVEAWASRPAQESMGSLGNRALHFIPWLFESSSPYFLALAAIGIAFAVWHAFRPQRAGGELRVTSNEPRVTGYWFLVTAFGWMIPFLIAIGPAYRFQTILTPWLALAAGALLATSWNYALIRANGRIYRQILLAVLVIFLTWEATYSWNTLVALRPIGSRPWTFAEIRNESDTWGFNQLDQFFNREFEGKMPEIAVAYDFGFAARLLEEAIAEGRAKNLEPVPWGIVYDGSFNFSAQLWVFLRRIVYQGWPVTDHETFLTGGGEEFLREQEVKKLYVVNALEGRMAELGIQPIEVRNPRGEVAFRIYEYPLSQ